MQFNSILVLLLFMLTFVQTLHGQTCDCRFCQNSATVSASSASQVYNSAPCPAGTAAAVSSINVQSTDGSGFEILTQDDPSQTVYYTAGSTTSTVTCFKMGQGFTVGGQKSRIYVVIRCKKLFGSCSLRYSISLTCVPLKTTSTPEPTSASTVKPVNPPTVATVTPGNQTTMSLLPGTKPDWIGIFNLAHKCDTRTCCCPSGQITLSRKNNNNMRVQCQYVCPSPLQSLSIDDLISMPTGFNTQVIVLGNPILIELSQDSRMIDFTNPLYPLCSETATRNNAMSKVTINLALIALFSGFMSLEQFIM